MIFALLDYLNYRNRTGRYGDEQEDGGMALAWVDDIPDECIAQLRTGDLFVTQRLNSPLSWAMMYFTSSSVDHAGGYEGDGQIVHMTLSGPRRHSLRSIAKGARILPFRMDMKGVPDPFGIDAAGIKRGARLSHVLPAKLQLAWVGLRIALGYYPDRFKWKFLGDFVIICALIDTLLISTFGIIGASVFALGGLTLAVAHQAKSAWRNRRGIQNETISHPDILYRAFFRNGGVMFSNMGPLVVSGLGLLPMDFFLLIEERLGLRRKGPDDGSDNELQETSQLSRYRFKDGDIESLFGDAESEDCQQDENQEVQKSPDHPRKPGKDA